MARSARIVDEKLIAEGRFRLTRTQVAVVEDDGVERRLDHEIYRHKNAAAVLLYDPARGLVTLVRQFRVGAYLCDGATQTIEVCAGMLDDAAPETCAIREAFEETGLRLRSARHVFDAYTSPGGTTEKISLFVAPYSEADRMGAGGGVDADEHIEVLEIPFAQALAMVARGEVKDAKTICLLYYARAERILA
jgi:GDP-mannose pyrophosphatase NudK